MSRSEDVQKELESLLRDEVDVLGSGDVSEDAKRLVEQSSGSVFVTNVPGQELSLTNSVPQSDESNQSQDLNLGTDGSSQQDASSLEAELDRELGATSDEFDAFRLPPFSRADAAPGGHLQTTDDTLVAEPDHPVQDLDLPIAQPSNLIDLVVSRSEREGKASVPVAPKPVQQKRATTEKTSPQPTPAKTVDERIRTMRHEQAQKRAIALQRSARGDPTWTPVGLDVPGGNDIEHDDLDTGVSGPGPSPEIDVPPVPEPPKYRSSVHSTASPKIGMGELPSDAASSLESISPFGDYDSVVETLRKLSQEQLSLFRDITSVLESHSAELREIRTALERASV